MKQFRAQLEVKINTSLGEGPLWHQDQNRLYFVDIVNFKVHSYDPVTKDKSEWSFPSYVGAIARGDRNELFVAAQNELVLLDPQAGSTKSILSLDLAKDIRFNECKCDPQGRFWMGTMHLEAKKGAGALYRVDLEGSVVKVLPGLSVPNGFCWSLDNQYMYHIDTFDHAVKRFDYNEEPGSLTNPGVVISLPGDSMLPDGMCIDRNGNLWIAMWGGGKVACYNPKDGELIAQVEVPAPHVTSCAFGGDNFDTLYITTARLGLTDDQLEEYPLSGSVFSCKVGVGGFETFKCRIQT